MNEHAIIENCTIFYPRLDPKNPNKRFDPQNPSWEIQIRTTSKAVKDLWISQNLNPKKIIPEDEDENPLVDEMYWKVNFQRNSFNSKGEPSPCPDVVDGNLDPVDGRTIGNGSVGNVKLFQYPHQDGVGTGSVLMGVQLTKHVVYKPTNDIGFGQTTTEVITPVEEPEEDVPFEKDDKKASPKIAVGTRDDEDVDF